MVFLHNRGKTLVALVMLLLFILPIATPLSSADNSTSARSDPDFLVTNFVLDGAGSIQSGSEIFVENATHTANIYIANIGSVSGGVVVSLYHQGSPTSNRVLVDSFVVDSLGSQQSYGPILISWTASPGNGQVLFAETFSTDDSRPGNNQQALHFDVRSFPRYNKGDVLSSSLPTPAPGNSVAVVPSGPVTFSAVVENQGVQDIDARLKLTFVDSSDPTNIVVEEDPATTFMVPKGSLKIGPTAVQVDYTMSTQLSAGVWSLTAEVLFTGQSGYSELLEFGNVDVRFSDFAATLSTPADRTTQPGLSTTLNYWLTMTGAMQDSYTLSVSSVAGWATLVSTTPTNIFSNGHVENLQVIVDVPADASSSAVDAVTLTLTSINDPSVPTYTLSVTTYVFAGESYVAKLNMPTGPIKATPGEEVGFIGTIENQGNRDGSYDLYAGVSTANSRWSVRLGASNTGIINVSEVANFSVYITVPKIQMPLDSADHNGAGDTLTVWVQAIPTKGGIPAMANTTVEVAPAVVIDPGLEEQTIDLTVAEVIAAKNGDGLTKHFPLSIELRHNLDNSFSTTTVDGLISVGNLSFTPLNNGGYNEVNRWNTSITNESLFDMMLGTTKIGTLGVDTPDQDYPLAGTMRIPVTTSIPIPPTIPDVQTANVTRNITINIPPVQGVDIIDKGPHNVPLAEPTRVGLALENTGNDLANYRLSVIDDLPEGWIASVNTTTATNDQITDLEADVADDPSEGNSHIRYFELQVTTDNTTPAESLVDVNIKIEDSTTGVIVDVIPVTVEVGPSIGLSLSPATQVVDINTMLEETPITRVFITNTGNTPTVYSVWLDDSDAGEVEFTLESPNEILIAPGFTDSVKVRLASSIDADSTGLYRALVYVSAGDEVNESAEIIGNVSEQSDLRIDAPSQIGVLPGQEQVVDFTVINSGNLQETFNVDAAVDTGWTVVPQSQQMTLSMDEENLGSVTVTVPEIGQGDPLSDGSVHDLTISLVDQETGLPVTIATVRLVISPMFILDIVEWTDEMEFHKGDNRTFSATVANMGNRDVTVDLTYQINRPGDVVASDEWKVRDNKPTSLPLPVGQNVTFVFTVTAEEDEPYLDLNASLSVQLTPRDADVDGVGYLNSTLVMSRFFAYEEFGLQPDKDDGPMEASIIYSHIPIGASSSAAYELELCSAERLYPFGEQPLDDTEEPLDAADYPWEFTIILGDQQIPLSLDPVGCGDGSAGEEHRIQLPSRNPWVTTDPIEILVDAPDRPNILAGDGWDLTFRLFHETENLGYTVFEEETFTFKLDVFADPSVDEIWVSSGTLEEGTDATISSRIRNEGTALARFFTAALECSGSTVHTEDHAVQQLGPNNETILEWQITSDTIDWWRQSIDGTCVVTLDASMADKNVLGNDVKIYKDEVYSWSPGQSSSFVAFIIFGLLSLVLARLNGQNEKFRLFSTYAGILAFGFAFHLFNIVYWGPAVLLIAALWLWRMTWMSTDEFRLIHEDYQRARKGVSTLYADHFQALADSRRQLRIILALPVFGLLGVVLGIPPQIDTSQNNLLSIAAYVLVLSLGVSILVRRADTMYGALYGRLTDIEVKAIRIERDLSDPARLLNDLANDGINLDAIFDDLQSGVDLATEEEVSDDV